MPPLERALALCAAAEHEGCRVLARTGAYGECSLDPVRWEHTLSVLANLHTRCKVLQGRLEHWAQK